jgi:phosphotransferase family enzyme
MTGRAAGVPTGKRTWLDERWRAEALQWAADALAGLGRRIDGEVEQPHVRPWSTAMRIPTDGGLAWFKASGPASAHEGPLLEVLRERAIPRVLLPLAVNPDCPWILFEDGGTTLRQTRSDGTGDHDVDAWERILREYAELQRKLESDDAVDAMLAAGAPDGRPEALPGELARLLEDDVIWDRLSAEERDDGRRARSRLGERLPEVAAMAAELAAIGVRASIQHDDLHGGNILVGPAGDRFFDWGDAVVAHPFSTLTVTFNSIAHNTGLAPDDPVFTRLEDVYLEAWTDVVSRAELERAADIARVFGCIGRSLAWERALAGLAVDEMDGFGDSIAGWLVEFSDRLDALTR